MPDLIIPLCIHTDSKELFLNFRLALKSMKFYGMNPVVLLLKY